LREIVVEGGFGIENLTQRDVEIPMPGERELLVRMEAASLNYVDLAMIEGTLDPSLRSPFVPVADGAGVVEQVGLLVDEFRVGDRVSTMYIPPWRSGRYERRYTSLAIRPGGGHVPGQLAEYKLFTPEEVVLAPLYMSAIEAATLPIAALTAWNALAYGEARAGDTVLIHGTGGVSLFALQFAKILGLRAIITSSSDEKLQRTVDLGADRTINYAETAASRTMWPRPEVRMALLLSSRLLEATTSVRASRSSGLKDIFPWSASLPALQRQSISLS